MSGEGQLRLGAEPGSRGKNFQGQGQSLMDECPEKKCLPDHMCKPVSTFPASLTSL